MLTIYAHIGKAIPDLPPEGTPEGPEKTRAREAFENNKRRGGRRVRSRAISVPFGHKKKVFSQKSASKNINVSKNESPNKVTKQRDGQLGVFVTSAWVLQSFQALCILAFLGPKCFYCCSLQWKPKIDFFQFNVWPPLLFIPAAAQRRSRSSFCSIA